MIVDELPQRELTTREVYDLLADYPTLVDILVRKSTRRSVVKHENLVALTEHGLYHFSLEPGRDSDQTWKQVKINESHDDFDWGVSILEVPVP